MSEHLTIALDAARRTALKRWIDTCDDAVTIHPTVGDEPFSGTYFQALHNIQTRGLISPTNVSSPLIFEFNYRDGDYQFRCLATDELIRRTDTGRIGHLNRSLDQHSVPPTLVDARPGQSLAACSVVSHPDHPWPLPVDDAPATTTPCYRSLVPSVAHSEESELLIQVVAHPAMRDPDWLRDRLGPSLHWQIYVHEYSRNAYKRHERYQRDRSRPSYHVNIRLLGLAQSPAQARILVGEAATRFSQRFAHGILMAERIPADELDQFLKYAATRTWIDRSVRLTDIELGRVWPLPHEAVAPWTVRLPLADPIDMLAQQQYLAADNRE